MKNTGVIRSIDNQGRIVIPSEIRNTMGLNEGIAMEFYIDNGNIVLKKYEEVDVNSLINNLRMIKERLDSDSELDMDINQISKFWSKDIEDAIELLERR